ncbi:MAG: hypothetical protein E7266_08605 [Lachnospiraceae bacterium]|nr:hypothetical protein [Lachnospiraceae bacterium]
MDRFIEKVIGKDDKLTLEILQAVFLGIMGTVAIICLAFIYPMMIFCYLYHGLAVMIVYVLAVIVLAVLSFVKLKKDIRKVARVLLFGSFFIPIYLLCIFAHGILTGWFHVG